MKNRRLIYTIIIIIFSLFYHVKETIASDITNMPPEEAMGDGGIGPGPVVGEPIDDYIPLLIIAAIILGLWAINKHKKQSAITE